MPIEGDAKLILGTVDRNAAVDDQNLIFQQILGVGIEFDPRPPKDLEADSCPTKIGEDPGVHRIPPGEEVRAPRACRALDAWLEETASNPVVEGAISD